jgi:hypothetical protein
LSSEYQLQSNNIVTQILDIPHRYRLKSHKVSEAKPASVFNLKKERKNILKCFVEKKKISIRRHQTKTRPGIYKRDSKSRLRMVAETNEVHLRLQVL